MSDFKEELELEHYLAVLSLIGQCTDDYMYFMDFEEDYYSISESATKVFALKEAKFGNATAVLGNVFFPEDLPIITEDLEMLKAGVKNTHNLEYRWLDKFGNPVWISCRGVVVKKNNKPRYMLGRISELGKQNRIDKVTGLYQSEVLRDKIDFIKEIGNCQAGLMIIGIDNLKGINEWHGSSMGDYVLKNTAGFIEKSIGSHGQVFRLDGDLIAVFTVEKDYTGNSDAFKALYKTIRSKVDKFMEESSYQLFYTISAGSVVFDIGCTKLDSAVMKAKFALQRAKLLGKNVYVQYNSEEHKEYIKVLDIQEELRRAINNNFDGFEMYYQPIIHPADSSLYGAEALLRWNSKKYGPLSPSVIVPILESSGLVIPLGKWTTKEASKQCLEWQKEIPGFRMNINLSYVQLLKSDVIKDMNEQIDTVGVSHDNIVFEVTESGELESNHTTRNVLESFIQSGFCLAIDDFGTGYSNLRYIKEMMFNLIKIDRIFIKNINESEYNYMLVKHVTDLAHSLKLSVCMEGVETQEELDTVMKLSPDCIQGYYYSKPLCASDFAKKYID